jgi:hypothetical protein
MRIIDDATRAATIELEALVTDYWFDVDENDSRAAPEFFTEECVFDPGIGAPFVGRVGVRAFYDNRALRGKRTTRHTFSNFKVTLEGPTRAAVNYVSVLYAADGPAPITNFVGPAVISDVACICERDAAGQWRFKSLRGRPAFIGNEPYSRGTLVKS